VNNFQKYTIIFCSGILLQIACVIGSCITALRNYDTSAVLNDILFVPYFLSFILIIFGFIGLVGLFDLVRRKFDLFRRK